MHSRAYLLITNEIKNVNEKKPLGIDLSPAFPDSIFKWIVKLKGSTGTDWEGGIFKLSLEFTEEFNQIPPHIQFLTIPFHPNVEPVNGFVALRPLRDKDVYWKPDKISLLELLISIQQLLTEPDPNCIVNSEAAELLIKQPELYRHITHECVQASRDLEEKGYFGNDADQTGLITKSGVHIVYDLHYQKNSKKQTQPKAKVARVNFEEYLATWAGIATSKATPDAKNPYLSMIQHKPNLISVHQCLPTTEIEAQLVQQMEQHRAFVYGNVVADKKKPPLKSAKDDNIKRIEKMRKIYISQKTHSNLSRPAQNVLDATNDSAEVVKVLDMPKDEDVDDLVAWTENLDQGAVY